MPCLKLIKAVIARGLFAIHAFVTVWRVVDTKNGEASYWFLATAILLLIFEGMVSACSRNGEEMKWFCPSVFLYLLSVVPPIWVLELDMAMERQDFRRNHTRAAVKSEQLSSILNFSINISLPREMWTKVLEQISLVMLITGRWLLPKGDLTRDQLSQLLLVYLGMAADIVELFEAFKEDAVVENLELTYAILGIWSWSLLQFTLVLTATHARKPRLGVDSPRLPSRDEDQNVCIRFEESIDMDIVAILTTVILQDGPFLVLRMTLIFHYNVVSYLNIFFTCKNTLVASLQLYRFSVLCVERRAANKLNPRLEILSLDEDSSSFDDLSERTDTPNDDNGSQVRIQITKAPLMEPIIEEDSDEVMQHENSFKRQKFYESDSDISDLQGRTEPIDMCWQRRHSDSDLSELDSESDGRHINTRSSISKQQFDSRYLKPVARSDPCTRTKDRPNLRDPRSQHGLRKETKSSQSPLINDSKRFSPQNYDKAHPAFMKKDSRQLPKPFFPETLYKNVPSARPVASGSGHLKSARSLPNGNIYDRIRSESVDSRLESYV